MIVTEIIIAVLLGLLVVVTSAYLTYFQVSKYRLMKARLESGDYEEEPSVKGKVLSILLTVYFAFSLFCFTTNLIYRSTPLVGNSYYVSVNSDSMSQALSSNTYLKNNNLTNQIAQYNIAVIDKIDVHDVQKYDVIMFKKNNTYIVHRVVQITSSGNFVTQGDKNINPDNWEVTVDEVIGKYSHSLVFMSFINYLGYTPGFYVALTGVTYDLGVLLLFEIKKKSLLKQQNS